MTILVDDDTESLAHRLASLRGETVDQAIKTAVREALRRAEPLAAGRPAVPLVLDPANPLAGLTPAQRSKVQTSIASINLLPPLGPGNPIDHLDDENGLPR